MTTFTANTRVVLAFVSESDLDAGLQLGATGTVCFHTNDTSLALVEWDNPLVDCMGIAYNRRYVKGFQLEEIQELDVIEILEPGFIAPANNSFN